MPVMQGQAENFFIMISIHNGQVFPCFNNITWLTFHSWRTTSAFPLSVVFNLAEAFLVIWWPVTSTQSKIYYKQESGETCSCACQRQNYITACVQISKHYSLLYSLFLAISKPERHFHFYCTSTLKEVDF